QINQTASTTIESSGSGALVITNYVNAAAGNKTLNLIGFSNDANRITSVLADNGGSLRVFKSDGGTWELTGNNTLTGGVRVDGGYLGLGSNSSLGTIASSNAVAAAVANSATITLSSGTTAGLTLGMNVTGNGIGYGDVISTIVDATTFTINNARTVVTGSPLYFGGLLMSNAGVYSVDPAGLTIAQPLIIASNTTAIFSGTAPITLNGPIVGASGNPWTISNVISGSTLTINGGFNSLEAVTARALNIVGTGNTAFNAVINSFGGAAATVNVVYNTSGTVTIGGATIQGAAYIGGTLINEGTIIVNKAGALNPFGAANVLAMAAGTLQSNFALTGGNALVTPLQVTNVYGVISGTNSIEFAGNGTQAYSLQNNGGNRIITNNLTGPAALSFTTQPVNLSNDTTGRTLTIAGSGNTTISSVVQNGAATTGSLTYSGTGTLTLTGANTAVGALTANSGTVVLSGASGAWTGGTASIGANPTGILRLDNSGTENLNRILDTVAVNLSGGRLDFIGDGNGTTETMGVLTLGSVDSSITMSGAGPNVLTFASVLFPNTGSALDVSGITGLGSTNKIIFTTAPALLPATSGILSKVFLPGGADFATYNHDGLASNANGIQAMAAGAYVTTNDINGTANTGTMNITASPAALTASKTINAMKINGTGITVGSNNGLILTLTAAGVLNTVGNNTLAQTNTAFAGVVAAFQVNSGTTLNVTGGVTGANGIALAGGGTLTFSTPNFIVGTNNILNGTIKLNGGLNSLYPNQLMNLDVGGTLDLNGNTQYVERIQSGGTLPNTGGTVTSSAGTGTLVTNMNPGGTTFSGQITGSVNFARLGGNTLTFEGPQTYTGPTILMGGTTLLQDSASILNTSAFTLNYATLTADNNAGLFTDNTNRISDVAPITMRGGVLTFNGRANSFSSE
ncbi:MAG: hypothetical protein JWO89_3805, partial [Verrucomicrobiaceae bacterium]|nr:hypothetical protein [Verrucomicrobiaceae bacterium]